MFLLEMLKILLTTVFFPGASFLSEPEESVLVNSEKYTVIKEAPKNSDCKGSEVLKDDDGTEFCIAKSADPSKSSRIENDNSQYAECGRENLPDSHGTRIIGGSPIERIRFPWLAYIKLDSVRCTGSIISSRVIVFAAHCTSQHGQVVEATVGVHSLNDGTRINRYRGLITNHPNFIGNSTNHGQHMENDIAVMTTFIPIEFNKNVGPICLPQVDMMNNLKEGTQVTAVGYGVFKNLASLVMKYNLVTTKQVGAEEFHIIGIEEGKKLFYKTFAELLPYLPEILDKNFKVLKEYTPQLAETFADKNLEKLKTTLLMKITDADDRNTFQKLLPPLIKTLLLGEYDDENGLTTFLKDVSKIGISPVVAQTTSYKLISPQYCIKAMREYIVPVTMTNVLCTKTTEKARVCFGDSGGPAAVVINGKYYLVGVLSMSFPAVTLPLISECTFTKEMKEIEALAMYEDIKIHLPFLNNLIEKAYTEGNKFNKNE